MTVIHLPALPYAIVADPRYSYCAFSSKIMRFPAIMQNHKVLTYAPRGSRVYRDGPGGQHETTLDRVLRVENEDLMVAEGGQPEWGQRTWTQWDASSTTWRTWNERCIDAIRRNYTSGDVIAIIGGRCQEQVADAFPKSPIWEFGVGYHGVMDRSWVTFESNSWRSAIRGPRLPLRSTDSVIPNGWFASEFDSDPVERLSLSQGGYLAFLGRLNEDKGLGVLRHLTELGYRIRFGGPGDPAQVPGAEYVGILDSVQRTAFLKGAVATLVPSQYNEPFGAIAVESLFCGTPTIATDGAAFVETVGKVHRMMLANRLSDWVESIEYFEKNPFNPIWLEGEAQRWWSVQAVRPQYERVLAYMLDVRDGAGWMKL